MERRSRARTSRQNSHLEGVVWSEREGRLVPPDSPAANLPALPRSAPPAQQAPDDKPLPMSPPGGNPSVGTPTTPAPPGGSLVVPTTP